MEGSGTGETHTVLQIMYDLFTEGFSCQSVRGGKKGNVLLEKRSISMSLSISERISCIRRKTLNANRSRAACRMH